VIPCHDRFGARKVVIYTIDQFESSLNLLLLPEEMKIHIIYGIYFQRRVTLTARSRAGLSESSYEVDFTNQIYRENRFEIISLLKGPILFVWVIFTVYLFQYIAPVVLIKFEAVFDLALGARKFDAPLVG
jgi:hypothetical protein